MPLLKWVPPFLSVSGVVDILISDGNLLFADEFNYPPPPPGQRATLDFTTLVGSPHPRERLSFIWLNLHCPRELLYSFFLELKISRSFGFFCSRVFFPGMVHYYFPCPPKLGLDRLQHLVLRPAISTTPLKSQNREG